MNVLTTSSHNKSYVIIVISFSCVMYILYIYVAKFEVRSKTAKHIIQSKKIHTVKATVLDINNDTIRQPESKYIVSNATQVSNKELEDDGDNSIIENSLINAEFIETVTEIHDPVDVVTPKHNQNMCSKLKHYSGPLSDEFENSTFQCLNMSVIPVTPICVYDPVVDVFISQQIIKDGLWEAHIVSKFQDVLKSVGNNKVTVVDLGANIGMYSLIAAKMGFEVLAVEPFSGNLLRLYRAIQLAGDIGTLVTILQNGISDKQGQGYLIQNPDNQGDIQIKTNPIKAEILVNSNQTRPYKNSTGPFILDSKLVRNENFTVDTITMDCLVKYITKPSAIIKIDIQGYEHRAFKHFNRFSSFLYVPYIFMEWVTLREFYQTEEYSSVDKDITIAMIENLQLQGYNAYSQVSGKLLKNLYWYGWPEDVLWKHKNADAFHRQRSV